MEGTDYKGTMKDLPNIDRPALPPGVQAGGHGGSHGRLSNEFVHSIIEDRTPLVNIAQALNMTVCGIVANQSALNDGRTTQSTSVQDLGLKGTKRHKERGHRGVGGFLVNRFWFFRFSWVMGLGTTDGRGSCHGWVEGGQATDETRI